MKESDYKDIVDLFELKFTQKEIAKSFNVSPKYVSQIIKERG